MKEFDVYLTEEILFTYTVMAETADEAREKILQGDIDYDSYEVIDSSECLIQKIEQKK